MAWQARSTFARLLAGSALSLALLLGPFTAAGLASIDLGPGAAHPTLRVDAAGDAQVTWVAHGVKKTVILTAHGKVTHKGSLPGPDVSKRTHVAGVPSSVLVRRTPGGDLWALQLIAIRTGKPASLDLSHWKGVPTVLKLGVHGDHLQGSLTFAGKPVTGFSTMPTGPRKKIYVYLECFHCGGHAGWAPMLGVAPRHDGSFSVYLRPTWKASKYRATVAGPNTRTVYAPDAQVVVKG